MTESHPTLSEQWRPVSNLYRYCHNDSVNKSDPTGLYFEFTAGSQKFWEKWTQRFNERWRNAEFRSWWNRAAANARDAYVIGPPGSVGASGFAANPTLPHVMARANDGSSAVERAQKLKDSGRKLDANLTHYGYPGDRRYGDRNSRLGLGNSNNILNPDSVALSPDKAEGSRLGAEVRVNGQFVGFYHDSTRSDLTNRVDVYDPNGSFH